MDYTYITQLIDRYFSGDTSQTEEQMLRLFFQQDPLPQDLSAETAQYAPLFRMAVADRCEMRVPQSLTDRIEALARQVEAESPSATGTHATVKAIRVSLADRLKPLARAAAAVAVLLTLGNAMQFTMQQAQTGSDEINYAEYQDTYTDPNAAYQQASQALLLLTEGLAQLQQEDTTGINIQHQ